MKTLDEIKFKKNERRQAGMTVPEGFFEQFQQQLEAKIDTLEAVKPAAPVVEMPRRDNSTWLTRAAVAACAVLLVGVGLGVYLLSGGDPLATDIESQYAQKESVVDESEMEDLMVGSVNDYELYEYYCEL